MNPETGVREIEVTTVGEVMNGTSAIAQRCGRHLYAIWNEDGEALYVGRTLISVRKRLWQHSDKCSPIGHLIRTNWAKSQNWLIKIYHVHSGYFEAEKQMIHELNPKLNIVRGQITYYDDYQEEN
ncbi:MAG: GIY-YIG nuclease family protein [Dehalococcoidales bacterium]|nr:GIY-YIG nuclease family protein [Dehalococcoidales bacterium]